MRNGTITTFILLGLTDDPELQVLIFIFLFLTYMLSVTGNLTIITLTFVDPHLKTHMYLFFFFTKFLLLRDLIHNSLYSQVLVQHSNRWQGHYYNACVIQVIFTALCGVSEFFLLAAVSYDHYVAICRHLLCDHHEQQHLQESYFLLLVGWIVGHNLPT